MMFVSQIPNTDPRPYRNTSDGSRWPDDGGDPILLPFKPRPEYDHTRDPWPYEGAYQNQFGSRARFSAEHVQEYRRRYPGVEPAASWAPRREQFDVPVNRVLAEFRRTAWSSTLRLADARFWLTYSEEWRGSPEEIDHARRVLSKLVSVYGA